MTSLPMVDFEMREQFAALLVEHEQSDRMYPGLLILQNAMEDELLARYHELKPKAKLKLPPQVDPSAEISADTFRMMRERWEKVCKVLKGVVPEEHLLATVDRFRAIADEQEREKSARRQVLRDQLAELAMKLTPRPGDAWLKVDTFDVYRFSSQPAAGAYARTNAELRCLDFMEGGLKAQVRHCSQPPVSPGASRTEVYEVWVMANPVDIEIVKHGHALLLSDWLQQVHCRAMNPRVLMPGLPWGVEERYGTKTGLAAQPLLRPVEVLYPTVGVPQGTSP